MFTFNAPPSVETRIKNTIDLKATGEMMPRREAAAASDLRLLVRSEAAAVKANTEPPHAHSSLCLQRSS